MAMWSENRVTTPCGVSGPRSSGRVQERVLHHVLERILRPQAQAHQRRQGRSLQLLPSIPTAARLRRSRGGDGVAAVHRQQGRDSRSPSTTRAAAAKNGRSRPAAAARTTTTAEPHPSRRQRAEHRRRRAVSHSPAASTGSPRTTGRPPRSDPTRPMAQPASIAADPPGPASRAGWATSRRGPAGRRPRRRRRRSAGSGAAPQAASRSPPGPSLRPGLSSGRPRPPAHRGATAPRASRSRLYMPPTRPIMRPGHGAPGRRPEVAVHPVAHQRQSERPRRRTRCPERGSGFQLSTRRPPSFAAPPPPRPRRPGRPPGALSAAPPGRPTGREPLAEGPCRGSGEDARERPAGLRGGRNLSKGRRRGQDDGPGFSGPGAAPATRLARRRPSAILAGASGDGGPSMRRPPLRTPDSLALRVRSAVRRRPPGRRSRRPRPGAGAVRRRQPPLPALALAVAGLGGAACRPPRWPPRRCGAARGPAAVLLLWSGTILAGGAVEAAAFLRHRRAGGTAASAAPARSPAGCCASRATPRWWRWRCRRRWSGTGTRRCCPASGSSSSATRSTRWAGWRCPPFKPYGLLLQVGGLAALLPGTPAFAIFAAATGLGNLGMAYAVWRARRHAPASTAGLARVGRRSRSAGRRTSGSVRATSRGSPPRATVSRPANQRRPVWPKESGWSPGLRATRPATTMPGVCPQKARVTTL